MNDIEASLSRKIARKNLLQSQKRALLDEYMPIKEELETVEEEIEKLEEELKKIDNVQSDARLDELIESINDDGVKTIEENEAIDEELSEPQHSPKPWSHADDENDNDR
jgi:predicted nuclease with TOPRIM domain